MYKPIEPVGAIAVLLVSEFTPKLDTYTERLETFNTYPKYLLPGKTELAAAGLHYTGAGDVTKCSTCQTVISDWRLIHDPLRRHAKQSPHCEFVLANATAEQLDLDVISWKLLKGLKCSTARVPY